MSSHSDIVALKQELESLHGEILKIQMVLENESLEFDCLSKNKFYIIPEATKLALKKRKEYKQKHGDDGLRISWAIDEYYQKDIEIFISKLKRYKELKHLVPKMINDYETIERERKREELWRIAEAEERREKQHEKEKIAIRKQEKADRIKAIAYREMEKSRDLASTVRRNLEITKSCPYCDCYLKVDEIHADHIHPVSKGGLSIETNMIMVCSACNSKKSDLTLNQFIAKFGLNRKVIEYNLSRLNKDF